MEVQVKITEILEPQSFLGKDGVTTYTRYSFVGTTFGDYPRTIYFQTLGQDKYQQMNIQLGGIYTISFDIESRKYNDKYFSSINAWKAVRENEQSIANQQQQMVQPQQQPMSNGYQQAPAPMPAYGGGYAPAPQPNVAQQPNIGEPLPF